MSSNYRFDNLIILFPIHILFIIDIKIPCRGLNNKAKVNKPETTNTIAGPEGKL